MSVRALRVPLGLAAVVAWTCLFIGSASRAGASCFASPTVDGDLARSDLVFVGTVKQLANGDRWATFAIEDLWKGDLEGPEVEVHAGPADPGGGMSAMSSIDRKYEAGVRYLVFAYDPTSHGYMATWGTSRFEDNNCSATQPYSASLDRFRPATAHRVAAATPATIPSAGPSPSPTSVPSSGRSLAPWIVALSAFALVGAIGCGVVMKVRGSAPATPA